MKKTPDSSFSVQASLSELSRIRAWINQLTEKSLSPEARLRLVQAVDEAASNSIEHGYTEGSGEIHFFYQETDTECTVILEDEAPVFNPLATPAIDPEQRYENGREGGYGIHIMKEFVETRHEERRPRGNRLIFKERKTHE